MSICGEHPAFPIFQAGREGLTKREYFAAAAMQGLLYENRVSSDLGNQRVAKKAIALADALIEALNEDGI